MASVREEAQALRAGLIGNVVNISEVVSWADARIAEGQGSVAPQLLDLALLRAGDIAGAVTLLGAVPGEWNAGEAGRHIARLVHGRLLNGSITERQAASALYIAMREGLAPDEQFVGMAYHFTDGVDLAVNGIYGNLTDLRTEMLDYLSLVCRT